MNPAPIHDVTLPRARFGLQRGGLQTGRSSKAVRLLLLCVLSGVCTASAIWLAAHVARWLAS